MRADPHERPGPSGQRELLIVLASTAGIMGIELIAGLISGSLALIADAGHMLTDASALALSFFAGWIASRPATARKTYGYYRTEILAAFINGVTLWLIVAWIVLNALRRFRYPAEIATGPMLWAAWIGLAVNLVNCWILSRARGHSLNVQGAWLHVLTDTLGSAGVVTAALVIRFTGWMQADTVASLAIAVLIAISSWQLITQSVNILLEAAPAHLSVGEVTEAMHTIEGVCEVHDVHLWTISTGLEAMSGHIIVDDLARAPAILEALTRVLSQRFRITHTTFQLELGSQVCRAAPGPSRV